MTSRFYCRRLRYRNVAFGLLWQLGEDGGQCLWSDDSRVTEEFQLLEIHVLVLELCQHLTMLDILKIGVTNHPDGSYGPIGHSS